jgi:hypothetical protein
VLAVILANPFSARQSKKMESVFTDNLADDEQPK